jgi:hypothetical protein
MEECQYVNTSVYFKKIKNRSPTHSENARYNFIG